MSDVTFDLAQNRMEVHQRKAEPWRVTLVDTGDGDADRRPPEARARLRRTTSTFCFTYGDGVARRRHRRAGRLPPRARAAGHGDRGAAAGALRRARPRGRRGHELRGEAARATAAGSTAASSCWSPTVLDYIEGDQTPLGSASRCEQLGRRRPAARLPARRLLAADGHAARQEPPRGALGVGPGALEGLGVTIVRRRLRAAAASSSPATPGSREAGSRSGSRELGARVTGFALAPPTRRPAIGTCCGLDIDDRRTATSATRPRMRRDRRDAQPGDRVPPRGAVAGAALLRDPLETWATNVMGTANVLDACRRTPGVRAIVVVTSDKCYENREWRAALPRERPRSAGTIPTAPRRPAPSSSRPAIATSFFRRRTAPRLATGARRQRDRRRRLGARTG